ncbi:MAG TPA: PEP-CTERM sorting domain-containing protein [Longimicrobiales bacterium]|nr:PEP-CTERM sorting domain-containing protein [Longimicrobiales bacterium]
MKIRPIILLLALALAFQPLSAQVTSSQSSAPGTAQTGGQDEDEDRKGSNVLAPAIVGVGLVAGAVVAGAMGGDDAPASAAASEEGPVWVPRATGSEGGPMLQSGDPATTEVAVPEPGMLGLLAMGALGLMGVIVFRRKDVTA